MSEGVGVTLMPFTALFQQKSSFQIFSINPSANEISALHI
jgi:hypothetical protein